MISLRLFNASDSSTQIDSRRLGHGRLVLGRGEDADWRLEDPSRRLSRRHCAVTLEDGRLLLEDLSTNGVFVGPAKRRILAGAVFPLECGEGFQLGDYIVVAELEEGDGARIESQPSMSNGEPVAVEPQPLAAGDGSLLDIFCAAAGLDVSAFSADDPASVMRRVGGVYREMAVGLADLMEARTSAKTEYRMDRTTIRPTDNNPLRWAGADRIGRDLLRVAPDGFLSGPEAVASALADVKRHLLCVSAGAEAMVEALAEAFAPEAIEARTASRASFLSGGGARAWKEYLAVHAQVGPLKGENGLACREFRAGYLRRLEELDRRGETC